MASSSKTKSFAFYTTSTWRRKIVAWSMLFFYLTQPILASAEVIADPKAPPNNTPIVQPAANGLPVVQIAAPTAGGVSHNFYQQFNVDPSGLILNNSRGVTQTQLAGYITGNPNLTNGSARIILNEVTSSNPSYLRGYTEVAGQKAEVIIANPNGIYGDGFGFINTSRAVLTTGTPVFGGSGSLEAFRVTGGQISIQGAGVNATDVDQVDLISRSVALNAGVWAKNINVVTGSNTVDHNTLKADPMINDATTVPQVAIDIGQLGGMYANKIYLVGTEKGVGVNSSGTIAAQAGDVTITSAGKVLLAGNTSATGNIQVAAEGDVTNQNTLYAQGNTSITTQGTLENSGTLVAGQHTTLHAQTIASTGTLGAGVKRDGTLGNAGDLALNARGAIQAQGQNMAAGNLTINGAAIDLVHSKNYAGSNASITTTIGDIDHSNGTMQVDGELTLHSQGMIRNDNGTINAEQLTISGENISNRSGSLSQLGQGATTISAAENIDNTAGTMSTNGDSLAIQADSVMNNQGKIEHAGTGILSVQTTGDINNDNGKLATNGQLNLITHSIDNTQGTIIAKGIDLNAQGTLGNDHGTIASSGDAIRMNVQGALSNEQGSIEANNGLELTAESIDNQKGSLVSLDASGLKITASQDIQNQSGTIGGNGDISLTAQSLLNSSGNLIAQGNIKGNFSQTIDNSSGNIKAQQSISLGQRSTNISNTTQGTISAGDNLDLKANHFDNTDGNLVAKQDVDIQAEDMTAGGTALAGQDVNLTIKNRFTQNVGGDLKANRDVNIVADTFLNQGSIAAVGDISLTVNEAVNDSGSKLVGNKNLNITANRDVANAGMMAGSTATMKAKKITNHGSIIADQLTVDADTLSNIGNTAGISANQSAALHLDAALHNTNGAMMYMGNKNSTLTINTLALDNSGVIVSGGGLTVEARTIQSSGTLGAGVQTDGTLGADGDLLLQASDTVAATGKNLAAGTVNIMAKDINLTGAKTGAGMDIHLTATTGDITNTGGVLQAKKAINLQAAKAVYNDKDAAGNAANLQGNAITINAKTISNVGSSMIQFGSENTNLTAVTNLDNAGGSIVTNGTNLTITADTITGNQSKIVHAGTGTLDITATTNLSNTNGSSIQTNGNVDVEAGDIDNTKGSITALQGIEVAGRTLTNAQGTLATSKEVNITLKNELNNQKGIMEAGKALTIQAQSIDNNAGSMISLDTSGMTVNATDNIVNTAGKIGSNGDVNLIAQSLINIEGNIISQGGIDGEIYRKIDNTGGSIVARGNVVLGSTETILVNATQGNILAGKSLTVKGTTLNNTGGTMAANQDVNLTASVINDTGTILAGQDINLSVSGDITNSVNSNVKANRDVNLLAENVNNLGSIAAVRNLSISTNSVINHATADLQGGSGLVINAASNVINNGTLEGDNTDINAQNIANTGSIFGDKITITADTISNDSSTAVIAATQNVNLFGKSLVENKDDATIYSMGDINIAGSNKQSENGEYIDPTVSVLNQSATIEADGNIGVYAGTLTNKKREFKTEQIVVSDVQYDQIEPGVGKVEFGNYYPDYYSIRKDTTAINLTPGNSLPLYLIREVVSEPSISKDSPSGRILAGNNLKFRGVTVNNELSQILANGTVDTKAININNTAVGYYRTTTRRIIKTLGTHLDSMIFINGYYGAAYDDITYEAMPSYSSIISGGQNVIIQGRNINNSTIIGSDVPVPILNNQESYGINQDVIIEVDNNINDKTSPIKTTTNDVIATNNIPINNMQTLLPTGKVPINAVEQTVDDNKFTIPTSGMYAIHKEPSSKYLIETNPRFVSYGNFISSDYILKQIGVDSDNTMKRLGDGFYEQKVVREQILELTGRAYLDGHSSGEEQFKTLMDNGAIYAEQFNLQVGVALTSEQMSQLTSNMVWMVEKDVDGQKVLVPEVYLSRTGNIDLKDNGAVISANNIMIKATDNVVNAGVIKANENVNIESVNIANYGGTISGSVSTSLDANKDILNIGGLINGGKVDLIAGHNFQNETASFTSTLPILTKTTTSNIASVDAGDSLTITAHDISIIGGELNAKQDAIIHAAGDIVVDSVQKQDRLTTKKYSKESVSNVVSSINAGDNISITSNGDTTLKGAQIRAGDSLELIAGGDINISAVKDEIILDQTVGIKNGWKRTRTDDETVIGASLQGNNQVTITTGRLSSDNADSNGGNITIEGSYIASDNGKVQIAADKDVTIQNVTEKHESLVVTHTKKRGFLSRTTKDTLDHSLINEVVSSTISGDEVSISSGSDLTIQASNIVGAENVSLEAKEDVNILSAAETGDSEHYSYTKKSGFFSGGAFGFTVGSQSTKITTDAQILGQVGSTIGSIYGNVSITAGEKVNSAGTTFISGEDLNITGKDVTIDNTINTYDSQTKFEFKQTGLTVSLGSSIIDIATSVYNNTERSGQVEDDRLKTLYQYKAYKDLKKLKKAYDKAANLVDPKAAKNVDDVLKNDLSINVSFGSTKTTSTSTVHTETVNTSNIDAGGDVNITATAGDINLRGTKIDAKDITLDAKDNINIESAENKLQTANNTSTSSASIGASFGLTTGAFGGLSGSFNTSKSHENEKSTTNAESIIDADGTLTMNSGNDTNIIGSQVKGDTVVANVDGNLNIVSKQDTDDYTSKNQSSGFGFTTGTKGGITGSVSQGKTDSTYASVTEQAGIYAGDGGFDINVDKNTDLKGAVIASDATPDKNKLSTDTLTYSDIQNHAEYDSSSYGVNIDTRTDSKYNEHGITPNIGMPASGDADSTTKSAIAPGTIIVGGKEVDPKDLSRDTVNSLNALGKIFDKQTVKEQQELASLFGELAYEQVHKISEQNGWASGSPEKVALHAFVGAIMADLGGGNAFAGGFGAGLNEAMYKELDKIGEENPDLRQWASFIIGSAAGDTVGGVTAYYGMKYNDQFGTLTFGDYVTLSVAGLYITGEVIKDKSGKVIAAWSSDAGGFVDGYGNYLCDKWDDLVLWAKGDSAGSLQRQVERGQAPKEVDRVDKPHVPGQKPHVHFKDGTSLNNDGTTHDAHKGTPNPSNKTKEWLKDNGWKVEE